MFQFFYKPLYNKIMKHMFTYSNIYNKIAIYHVVKCVLTLLLWLLPLKNIFVIMKEDNFIIIR